MMAAAALGGALLAAGCVFGGSEDDMPTPTRAAEAPPLPSRTATPAATARPSPSPSPSPSASPSPSPAPVSRDDVIAAAEQAVGGRHLPELTRAACLEGNPERRICIHLTSDDGALSAGLARFDAGDPDAGNFSFLMGRTAAGEWEFVRGSQQEFYELTSLPGSLRVCSEGAEAVVRAQPSAAAAEAGKLARLETVPAEAYVLVTGSSLQTPDVRAEGYYRVSGAVPGWVDGRDVSAVGLGSCDLHDATEGTSHG